MRETEGERKRDREGCREKQRESQREREVWVTYSQSKEPPSIHISCANITKLQYFNITKHKIQFGLVLMQK